MFALFFWLHRVERGILVPRPGIKSMPSAVGVQSLNHWTAREVPAHFFFFNFIYLFIYFIYGCVGSSPLREGPLQLRQAGATPHRGARAPHRRGLSCCGAQAPDAQAQQLWLTGPAAPRHVGSSQTRARTRVPRTGRQTPNHCATREAPCPFLIRLFVSLSLSFGSTLYIFWIKGLC